MVRRTPTLPKSIKDLPEAITEGATHEGYKEKKDTEQLIDFLVAKMNDERPDLEKRNKELLAKLRGREIHHCPGWVDMEGRVHRVNHGHIVIAIIINPRAERPGDSDELFRTDLEFIRNDQKIRDDKALCKFLDEGKTLIENKSLKGGVVKLCESILRSGKQTRESIGAGDESDYVKEDGRDDA